jgi:hypothetical protein
VPVHRSHARSRPQFEHSSPIAVGATSWRDAKKVA